MATHRDAAARTTPLRLLALAACLQLAGCAAPIVYPRSADLADEGRGRLRASTYVLGVADKSAQLKRDSGETMASDLSVSRQRDGFVYDADWVLGPVLSAEGGADYSAGLCEVGALASLMRVGAELRCALVQQDNGAPLSMAVSSAVLYPVDALLVGPDLPRARTGFRAGLDTSIELATWIPLFGLYVDHGLQTHALLDHSLSNEDMFLGDYPPVFDSQRWEWRISLPLGAVIGRQRAVTIGLVPEYTVAVGDEAISRESVLAFDRRWAVFLTLGAALTL